MRLDRFGERKHVSVLFADLVGSMTLIDQDPEKAAALLEDVLDSLRRATESCGGFVAQEAGDGLMALFGAPEAAEDHALRACQAALTMRDHINALANKRGLRLALRVGICTGDAVAGERGAGRFTYYTALGRTTHLASRFQKLAPPNGILISAETLALAQDWVETEPVRNFHVHGSDDAPAAVLLSLRGLKTGLQKKSEGLTPLVNRDAELALLEQMTQQAAGGRGKAVVIVGDPGVGKSRLLLEFAQRKVARGWLTISTFGRSHLSLPPFQGVMDALSELLPLEQGSAEAVLTFFHERTDLNPDVAAFVALCGNSSVEWNSLPPEQRRVRVARAVTAFLAVESRAQPILLIIEDLQWIDADSCEIFRYIARNISETHILLVATSRPEAAPFWGDLEGCHRVPLEPLYDEHTQRLLNFLLGEHPSLRELRLLLGERTGGNPLFVEESVRELASAATLAGAPGDYCLAAPLPKLNVPARVQDVIAMRLDRLSRTTKRVVQAASVCGHEFSSAILQSVLAMDADALFLCLEHLKTLHFLTERIGARHNFTFPHALIHEVVYGSLLRRDRRALHREILGVLQKEQGGELDQLALHAKGAELWQEAVEYLERAGQHALARSASNQAVVRFEEALSILPKLPETNARLAREVDLRLTLRVALIPLGQQDKILAQLEAAAARQARLGDPKRLAQIDCYRAHAAWSTGRWIEAQEIGQRVLAVAVAHNDLNLQATNRFILGLVAYSVGNIAEAIRYFEVNAREIVGDAERQSFGFFSLPSVGSRSWLAWCLAECGRFSEAALQAGEALRISKEGGRPFDQVQSLTGLGGTYLMQGRSAEAQPILEQAFEICQEAGTEILLSRLGAALGLVYALAGNFLKARDLQELALAAADRLPQPAMRPICLRFYAETELAAGESGAAAGLAQRLLEEARASGQRAHEAWGKYLRGHVASLRGEVAAAEADLREAECAAQRLGLIPLVAHCRYQLGSVWNAHGLVREGRRAIAAARRLYRSVDMALPRSRRSCK